MVTCHQHHASPADQANKSIHTQAAIKNQPQTRTGKNDCTDNPRSIVGKIVAIRSFFTHQNPPDLSFEHKQVKHANQSLPATPEHLI
jgi:hypothetical protein